MIRLLLATLAVLLALPASSALAGTYVVYGCWTSGDTGGWTRLGGGAPGVNAYAICPADQPAPNGDPGGLRDITSVGSWPAGATSGWVFEAPPNTDIVGVAAETQGPGGQETHANSWSRGIWVPDTGAWLATAPVQDSGGWKAIATPGMSARRVAVGLRCRANPCLAPLPGYQPKFIAWSAFRRLGVTIRDVAPPRITVLRPPPAGWLSRGRSTVSFTATDNVGVLWLDARLDGKRISFASRDCYPPQMNTVVAPCSSEATPLAANVDADLLSEGAHALVVVASDVAGNTREETLPIHIDHSAPVAPRGQMSAARAWRRENRFDVAWTNPPDTAGAPVARARFRLCPAANPPYAEDGCVSGERTGPGLSALEGLTVPGDGAWTLRLALVDSAGNHDPSRDAVFEGLWLDREPPQANFEPFDPQDPTRVRLRVSDGLSGVSRVEIEVRRQGEPVWRALDVVRTDGQYSAILDDGSLSDGLYELRARAFDAAGNEQSVTTFPDGRPMQALLPLRVLSVLTVGRSVRVRVKGASGARPRYRTVIVARPSLEYGQRVTIQGALTDDAGNPRDGAEVVVTERVDLPGMEWRVIARIKTDAKGVFTLLAPAGAARTLRFTYAGTATNRPRTQDVELRVRAATTLTPSRRRLQNGETVVFRGRLRGGPIPAGGKLMVLQAKTRLGWRTFATPHTNAAGRWSYAYTFTGTQTTARYAFRALIPAEPSYPYAAGASPIARVLVIGAGGRA
ncbi:carboxypeptidase-like regulatory domain-containing protein [Solirubrobacter soli]|uniref:carboxypeptidase-like regulatory domain-containing protein n=1 Tax=Solirubrobacter soli TaxID=363832 RepID=UPI0003FD2F8D|nr:Ig-like domain repeat protein [Solirubrobacter soli]